MPVPLGILATTAAAKGWIIGSSTTYDGGQQAVVDSEGNVYWYGSLNVGSFLWETYIVKFDPLGTILWQKKLSQIERGYDQIALDGSNNVYLRNRINQRVIKISSTGTFVWGATITGIEPAEIQVDTSGGVFIRETSGDTVAKLASAGNAISWAKSVVESTTNYRRIRLDPDGNCWLSATLNSDLRLIEFASSDGSQLTTIAKDSAAEWSRMAIASNGDIYIGTGNIANSFIVRRFNNTGTELNNIQFTGPSTNNNTLREITVDGDNNVYLLFDNTSTDYSAIYKLDASLTKVWRNGINLAGINPQLSAMHTIGQYIYVSGGFSTIWKLPNNGTGTGNYTVDSSQGVDTVFTYGSYTNPTDTTVANLGSDTGTATVTNPTVTVAAFSPTLSDSSLTFDLVPIG